MEARPAQPAVAEAVSGLELGRGNVAYGLSSEAWVVRPHRVTIASPELTAWASPRLIGSSTTTSSMAGNLPTATISARNTLGASSAGTFVFDGRVV